MRVEMVNISDIKPYKRNPRKNENAVDKVAESIKQFGWQQPIVVDKDGVIIVGHTRYKAAKKLGFTEVPVLWATDLTEKQVRAYRLADNKTNELAEWDIVLLDEELADIDIGIDMSAFGFELDEISLDEPTEVVEDEVPEVDEESEPITQLGDIWQLGEHRLMCGDSTDKETVKKLMDGSCADLLVTDPPYNVAYEGKTSKALTIENDSMAGEEFREFLVRAFECAHDNLKEGGAFYIWYASREHINFETALNEARLKVREQLIWVKNSLVLSRQDYHWKHEPCLYGWKDGAPHNWYSDRSQTTVLEFNRPSRNAEHPTMKPLDLIGYQIQNSSRKHEKVLDLFGGSGSTLIACEQLGRKCYTIELDPKYCDVIIKRYENFTGKKAVKIN